MKILVIIAVFLHLTTTHLVTSPNVPNPKKDWQRQLAAYLQPSKVSSQSETGSVVVLRFSLDVENQISSVTVFSKDQALNTYISKQLLGRKIYMPSTGNGREYTIRLHFH